MTRACAQRHGAQLAERTFMIGLNCAASASRILRACQTCRSLLNTRKWSSRGLHPFVHDGPQRDTDLVAVGAVFENADEGDVVVLQESGATVSASLKRS